MMVVSSKRRTALVISALKKDTVSMFDLGGASDWLCLEGIFFQPIRSTTKIWVVHVISMEFVRSLLRRRFARAQVATLRNVVCFLRLPPPPPLYRWSCGKKL